MEPVTSLVDGGVPEYRLADGTTLPAVGFGTYLLRGTGGVAAMVSALESGYRLLDTAVSYENEGAVGEAIRRSGIPREQIRVSSKLPGRHHEYGEAIDTVHESLYRTGLDYLDLYLIHWPNPRQGRYVDAWRALVDLRRQGVVRSIGVSNFLPEHLDRLVDETGVAPSVNQIELHPRFPQATQRAADAGLGIRTQSWSPLGRAGDLLRDPELARIAHTHGRSIPQTILRWHVQLGTLPLPKASHVDRQRANLEVFDFELGADEMEAISRLGRADGRLKDQDPAVYEEF
ncbi:aldo/keto reductase [Rhodococcus triatomae]|uniref:Aldo/keto reductase n=1 Tax=Rhodococcus triatomae TaxID=300028 RepID=A0A1G8SJP4_9NOCA|nr:aldo/keto reductase [Rhodococcus triatomae]QNG25383.1 aldo/keto reductase [Rhodococcus triatomae]SDJ29459.1 Aldo/keto reductase [Rhodococcus triatomae]